MENKSNLTEVQHQKSTDLKESVVLDQELQGYIDMYDKMLAAEKQSKDDEANEVAMGNVAGSAVGGSSVVTPSASIGAGTPMVMQLKKAPTQSVQQVQAQQSGAVDPGLVNSLRQIKMKMQSGQDASQDLQTLLQTIK